MKNDHEVNSWNSSLALGRGQRLRSLEILGRRIFRCLASGLFILLPGISAGQESLPPAQAGTPPSIQLSFVNPESLTRWTVSGEVSFDPKSRTSQQVNAVDPDRTGLKGFSAIAIWGDNGPNPAQTIWVADPLVMMNPGDALVATISMPKGLVLQAQLRNQIQRGEGDSSPIRTAAVLTCVGVPLPRDAFRPGFCDRQQKLYLARNLKRELLPKAAATKNLPPVEQYVRFR